MDLIRQAVFAVIFYFSIIVLFRISGKRLAGQTTTFDLMVMISLIVTLGDVFLMEGKTNKITFVVAVFVSHLMTSRLTMRFSTLRHLLRGRPSALIREGHYDHSALRAEGITVDEVNAGLRKLGIEDVALVQTAVLEETGQISAIRKEGMSWGPFDLVPGFEIKEIVK